MAGTNNKISKLNIQALSRQNKELMSCLVADKDKIFVSIDLVGAEPAVIAHYSKDPIYRAVTFEMTNKDPYYKDGILLIDDIYLSLMSVSPVGKDIIREVFLNGFEGVGFIDQWRSNKEVVQKKWFKAGRPLHKILGLGLGYAMGAKKMVKQAHNAGYVLAYKDAKAFYKAYWEMFKEVARLRDVLALKYKKEGRLVNQFGYALYPDSEHKALNYWIQSSVSGIINLLCIYFFERCQYADFVTIIHDELIISVPSDKVNDAKLLMLSAVDSLNETLNWSVKIKTGWAVGSTLYDAK